MSIDLGSNPIFPAPTTNQQAQIREAIGINDNIGTKAAAAIARREFSGGVRFVEGGYAEISPTPFASGQKAVTLYWRGQIHELGPGAAWSLLGNGRGAISENPNSLSLFVDFLGGLRFVHRDNASTGTSASGSDISLNSTMVLVGTADSDGNMVLYLNSESDGTATIVDYSNGIDADKFFINAGLRTNGIVETAYQGKSTVYESGIFNIALTATQVAELSSNGLEAFIAAHPEYQWGENTATPNATFSNISSSWDTFSGATAGGFTATNTTSDGRALSTVTGGTIGTYRIDYDITVNSGGGVQVLMASSSGVVVSNDETLAATSSGSITLVTTSEDVASLRVNAIGNTDIVLTGVVITKLGSLAYLPLTDDCRQLKDIGPNRYDAIASATGVTHMKQAERHSFRDDNATGTGSPYLIAAADILAANEVVTGVVVDGDYYAATGSQTDSYRRIQLVISGSDILVRRSNGTSVDTIATTTPASTSDFAITVLTSRY